MPPGQARPGLSRTGPVRSARFGVAPRGVGPRVGVRLVRGRASATPAFRSRFRWSGLAQRRPGAGGRSCRQARPGPSRRASCARAGVGNSCTSASVPLVRPRSASRGCRRQELPPGQARPGPSRGASCARAGVGNSCISASVPLVRPRSASVGCRKQELPTRPVPSRHGPSRPDTARLGAARLGPGRFGSGVAAEGWARRGGAHRVRGRVSATPAMGVGQLVQRPLRVARVHEAGVADVSWRRRGCRRRRRRRRCR